MLLIIYNHNVFLFAFCIGLFLGLGWLDRLLAPLVLVFMIVGTAVGATTGDAIPKAFDQVQFKGVSFRKPMFDGSYMGCDRQFLCPLSRLVQLLSLVCWS